MIDTIATATRTNYDAQSDAGISDSLSNDETTSLGTNSSNQTIINGHHHRRTSNECLS